MRDLFKKFTEVLLAVLPVTLIVLFIHLLIAPLETSQLAAFFLGAFFVWIGLSIFLIGIEIGVSPIGELFGKSIARSKKVWLILLSGLVLGILITIAEPDLLVVAKMVDELSSGLVSETSLVIVVALFIGIFVAIGLLRILFRIPLFTILLVSYILIFILAIFVNQSLHGIAFDISGATTGAMTVPFVLALALGVASMQRYGKSAEKDSFGLIGVASSGAIIGVLFLLLIKNPSTFAQSLPDDVNPHGFLQVAFESAIALLPIFLISLIAHFWFLHLRKRAFRHFLFGFFYTFIGLTLFLFGVYSGFLEVGRFIGDSLRTEPLALLLLIGFILGFFAILAEPAVYILTDQINHVTSGFVSKRLVVISLAIGVGLALVVNILRIRIDGFELWYFLVPGYLLALGWMFIAPKLFVGMAFDAGGVASGPVAATFIFAFSQGLAVRDGNLILLKDAFGMIAAIALVPILMVEFLGILYKMKTRKEVKQSGKQA